MFPFPRATEHRRGSFVCIYSFRGSQQRHFLKNDASKNTFFYRTPLNNCFFLLLSLNYLLTGQQKIDLCYIKGPFHIYQLIEVFVYILNNLKLMRKWAAATRVFIRMRHFSKTGVVKPGELLNTFQKKHKMNLFV